MDDNIKSVLHKVVQLTRQNPEFNTEEKLQNLGTGEAVVSTLDEKGAPSMAEYVAILPPQSRMGAISEEERSAALAASPLNSKYLEMVDNVSAYEVITGKAEAAAPVQGEAADGGFVNVSGIPAEEATARDAVMQSEAIETTIEVETSGEPEAAPARKTSRRRTSDDNVETVDRGGIGGMADSLLGKSGTRQVVRSTGGSIGREIGKTIGEAVLGKKGRTIGGNIGAALGRNLFGTLSRKK